MGKTLANDVRFAKFAKVFPCHHFMLYGTTWNLQASPELVNLWLFILQ